MRKAERPTRRDVLLHVLPEAHSSSTLRIKQQTRRRRDRYVGPVDVLGLTLS
jgi:hypothetical protein